MDEHNTIAANSNAMGMIVFPPGPPGRDMIILSNGSMGGIPSPDPFLFSPIKGSPAIPLTPGGGFWFGDVPFAPGWVTVWS